MPLRSIGVGLIGFGLAGRFFHAPVIRLVPGLRLAAILQRNGNEASEAYPEVQLVRSVPALLSIPDIRLIVIATPNDSHYQLAQECLAAGKDVVIDKPCAPTLQEANYLVEYAQKAGRLLTVFHNRRFDGDFQSVQQLVRDGALGRIVQFETNYDRFRPRLRQNAWRELRGHASGIFFDLGPHLIDHAMSLFGRPTAITADLRMERDCAITDDAFTMMLHYPDGMRAVLRSTMLAVVPRPRFVLHGTRASFVRQGFDPQEERLRRGVTLGAEPWTAEPEENWGVLTVSRGAEVSHQRIPPGPGDYRAFYANVREAMLGRAELVVTPRQALDVMCALELGRASSVRGCTVPWPNTE